MRQLMLMAIAVYTLISCQGSASAALLCFEEGHCAKGPIIQETYTRNEVECLQLCKDNPKCDWFSYSLSETYCQILSVNSTNCQDMSSASWVFGQKECPLPECWIPGHVQGTLYDTQRAVSKEECLLYCKTLGEQLGEEGPCKWFTFYPTVSLCDIFETINNNGSLDQTFENSISGQFRCPLDVKPFGLSKLLVANGEGDLKTVEVVDLASEGPSCSNLPDYKLNSKQSVGFLYKESKPIICGGHDGTAPKKECYSLETPQSKEWTQIPFMSVARADAAIAANEDQTKFFVFGGQGSDEEYLRSGEAYSSEKWTTLGVNLDEGVRSACAVTYTSNSILLIGGSTKTEEASQSVYSFDTSAEKWSSFSPLVTARRHHSCIKVNSTAISGEYVVVAGGWNKVSLSTVEFLEPESKVWKLGPELPKALHGGSLIEDTLGQRLLYIGGSNDESGKSSQIFALNFPLTVTSKWEVVYQNLQMARQFSTAFLIPDEFVSCTDNSTHVPITNGATTYLLSKVIFTLLLSCLLFF